MAARGNEGVSLGTNASGENCAQIPAGVAGAVDVFCGAWQEPAGHVSSHAVTTAESPLGVATSGSWRDTIDVRFACGQPTVTSILGGQPAAILNCARRIGGWPQVALVVNVKGRLYQADGILPALPVMERSIAILSGMASGSTVSLPQSDADTLLASQLAAHAFGAGDIGEFQRLMALGARANLAENFAAAEIAYRAALALQQRALGRDDPDTVNPLVHLALQLSDQERFAEADTIFNQADSLAPRANDPVAPARVHHYRALHALNQGQTDRALASLSTANAAYSAHVPWESLHAFHPPTVGPASQLANLPSQRLLIDPTAKSALIGLIEVYRYQAIVMRNLGRRAEAEAAIAAARALTEANQMDVPLVSARLTRTAATMDDAGGRTVAAGIGLSASRREFGQVVPGTRPVAETALLQAGVALRRGDTAEAIVHCRAGTAVLRTLRSGSNPTLLEPCLESFAAEANRHAGERQSLLAEMFETAELAQDTVTSRQIDEAAARLGAGARDPKVAAAIRRRQDASDALAQLYRQRDALVGGTVAIGQTGNSADLDKAVSAAQADLADADAAMQAAAPNFGQLVQQVVPAADVLRLLGPDEALVAIAMTQHGGWIFLLRGGAISAEPVTGDAAAIGALVKRVRAGIESPDGTLPRFDTGSANGLYNATLGKVASGLVGTKSLIVAPTGALLSLPFGLLLTGPADPDNLPSAPWLIRRMAVAHVPSAANFVALRKAGRSNAAHAWFGFGGFKPVSLAQAEASFSGATCRDSAKLFAGLPPLPFAQRELDAAGALFGAGRSDELLNAAFTADAVRRSDLKSYRILHFATHALLPAELRCEDEPAIVTSAPARAPNAAGALLTANAIANLDLDADTVILSACNSGGPGNTTSGESLSGLARAFFFAGARSMLVTHWSINDQSSAFLVADTLRRLAAHEDGGLAGALRAAQLGIVDRAGKDLPAALAHPYYWAPFALIGEGRAGPSA
jgi:CHAT domain-containing protein